MWKETFSSYLKKITIETYSLNSRYQKWCVHLNFQVQHFANHNEKKRKRAKAKAGKAAITWVDAMNKFNPASVADPEERPRGALLPPYFQTKLRPEGLKIFFFRRLPPPPPLTSRSGSGTVFSKHTVFFFVFRTRLFLKELCDEIYHYSK